MNYFLTLTPNQGLKLAIIFSKLKEIDITQPELIIAGESDVVHPDNSKAISLLEAVTVSNPIFNVFVKS